MQESRDAHRRTVLVAGLAMLFAATGVFASSDYVDLVALFEEFRGFQEAVPERGVRQYTPAAVEEEYEDLQRFRKQLAAFEVDDWPIGQQVDAAHKVPIGIMRKAGGLLPPGPKGLSG